MSQPNPNMTYEELRKKLIITFKEHHNLLPSTSYLDDLMQLFATLGAEVIGEIPPESEHWRYDGELLGRIQQQIQSTNRLAQLTTKNK